MEETVDKLLGLFSGTGSNNHVACTQLEQLRILSALLQKASKEQLLAIFPKFQRLSTENFLQGAGSFAIRQMIALCINNYFDGLGGKHLIEIFLHYQKEVWNKNRESRLVTLHCIGTLAEHFGRRLAQYFDDTLDIVVKLVRSNEVSVKLAAVRTLKMSVLGCESAVTYSMPPVIKVLGRCVSDRNPDVRQEAARCMKLVCSFSQDFSEMDNFIPWCVKGLSDGDARCRFEFAQTLGAMLGESANRYQEKPDSENDVKRKSKRSFSVVGLGGAVEAIKSMFLKAQGATVRYGIAQACVSMFGSTTDLMDQQKIPSYLKILVGLIPVGKASESEGAVEAVSHMLRYGLLRPLGELGMSAAGENLLKLVVEPGLNHNQVLCCLNELGFIIHSMGPAASDMKDPALEPLLRLLSDPSHGIRIKSGQCLRMLARAVPSQLSTLLRVLSSVVRMHLSDSHGDESTMFGMHGNAHGIALLVELIPTLETGVPTSLLTDVFNVAQELLKPKAPPKALHYDSRGIMAVCGWAIIQQLIRLGNSWAGSRLRPLFSLWKSALGKKTTDFAPKSDIQAFSQIAVRTQAMLALREFTIIFQNKIVNRHQILNPIVKLATNVLMFVKFLETVAIAQSHTAIRHVSSLIGAMMDIFALLPPDSYAPRYVLLLKLAVAQFTVRNLVTTSLLEETLDERDDLLLQTRNDEFEAFYKISGFPDRDLGEGSHWLPFNNDHSAEQQLRIMHSTLSDVNLSDESLKSNLSSQACSDDGVVAVNSCIRLFAKIFPHQNDHHKHQLISHFQAIVKEINKVNKLNSRESAILENSAAAIYLSCKEMLHTSNKFGKAKARDEILRIAQELLSCASVNIRRAAAESIGVMAKLEGSRLTTQLVDFLGKKFRSKDHITLAGSVFALGSVHSYVGAFKSSQHMPVTVASLQMMGLQTEEPLRLWVLHSLWKAMDVGGLSFSDYVRPTLALSLTHTVVSIGENLDAGVNQCLGRIAQAVLSAVGPELRVDNPNKESLEQLRQCLAIYDYVKEDETPAVQTEVLKCISELFQWAPQEIPVTDELVSMIMKGLGHKQLLYRHAALLCMRQFALLHPDRILQKEAIQKLFEMLDKEYSPVLKSDICSLLDSMTHLVAASHPCRVIQICRQVIEGRPERKEDSGSSLRDDDDDDDGDRSTPFEIPSSTPKEQIFTSKLLNLGWFAKSYATECLRGVLETTIKSNDTTHYELAAARAEIEKQKKAWNAENGEFVAPQEYLVTSLHSLLMITCRSITSVFPQLQIAGLKNLHILIDLFGPKLDPDVQYNDYLLTQYQAQIASALRHVFAKEAEPRVRTLGTQVTTEFIQHPVAGSMYVRRTIKSLLEPFDPDNKYMVSWGDIYGGHVLTSVTLSHLVGLAEVYLYSSDIDEKSEKTEKQHRRAVGEILQPELPSLLSNCMLALSDYVVVLTQRCRQIREFQGRFFHGSDCLLVKSIFVSNWKWFLKVSSELLQNHQVVDEADIHIPPSTQITLLVGTCMRFLDRAYRQFDNTSIPGTPQPSSLGCSAVGSPTTIDPSSDGVEKPQKRGHRRNLTGLDQVEHNVVELVSLWERDNETSNGTSRNNSETNEELLDTNIEKLSNSTDTEILCLEVLQRLLVKKHFNAKFIPPCDLAEILALLALPMINSSVSSLEGPLQIMNIVVNLCSELEMDYLTLPCQTDEEDEEKDLPSLPGTPSNPGTPTSAPRGSPTLSTRSSGDTTGPRIYSGEIIHQMFEMAISPIHKLVNKSANDKGAEVMIERCLQLLSKLVTSPNIISSIVIYERYISTILLVLHKVITSISSPFLCQSYNEAVLATASCFRKHETNDEDSSLGTQAVVCCLAQLFDDLHSYCGDASQPEDAVNSQMFRIKYIINACVTFVSVLDLKKSEQFWSGIEGSISSVFSCLLNHSNAQIRSSFLDSFSKTCCMNTQLFISLFSSLIRTVKTPKAVSDAEGVLRVFSNASKMISAKTVPMFLSLIVPLLIGCLDNVAKAKSWTENDNVVFKNLALTILLTLAAEMQNEFKVTLSYLEPEVKDKFQKAALQSRVERTKNVGVGKTVDRSAKSARKDVGDSQGGNEEVAGGEKEKKNKKKKKKGKGKKDKKKKKSGKNTVVQKEELKIDFGAFA